MTKVVDPVIQITKLDKMKMKTQSGDIKPHNLTVAFI